MQTYFFNNSDKPKVVGNVIVPPKQGRSVDNRFLPKEKTNIAPVVDADVLAQTEFLAKGVKEIREGLDNFSDQGLTELKALEQSSSTPRKGVLEAIDKTLMARHVDTADATLEAYATQWKDAEAADLDSELVAVEDDAGKRAIIEKIIADRLAG